MTERLALAARDTFRSLHVRNFRLFFFGQLVSRTGTWLTMVAQILLVLEMTDSGVALGLLTAFQFGPVLVLGAWGGAVADRADKLRLLLWLQAVAMLKALTLGIVVLAGAETLGLIYALALVHGVVTALDSPARRSFVVEMVPADDVPNAVSLNSAVMTGSRVLGPAAAGALVVTVGYGWTFIIDALSYLAVIAAFWLMRTDELYSGPPAARAAGQVRAGLRYIRSDPRLFVPLVMTAIIGTVAFNFQVTVPLLVTGPLGGDEGTFTLLYSVLSLGALSGALWTARRREVTPRQLVNASIAFGITMLALAAAPNLLSGFTAGLALGFASMIFMTSATAIVQVLAAAEFRGRVLAIQSMVFLGSTPIGGPIVGLISDAWGSRAGIAAGGLSCLIAAAYGARALTAPVEPRPVEAFAVAESPADDPAVTLTD